jgi:HSP20 family molecular chaperone IbpA
MSTVALWTRRDPFAEFDSLVRRTFGPVQTRPVGFSPAAEVAKDGTDAVIRVEVPGLDVTKDVAVEVRRGRLVVRGERRDERAGESHGHTLREVRYGSFRREFGLPAHIDADAISAGYDAGVLSIRVAGAYRDAATHRVEITSAAQAPAGDAAPEQPGEPAASQS